MTAERWSPETPKLTVDAVIRISGGEGIVLIKRKYPPFGWALPGGFVNTGETVEQAAQREAFEETGLRIENMWLLGVYSDPQRDHRFHSVSIVFVADAEGKPAGADDAEEARVFTNDNLPQDIVFDHAEIISDFYQAEKERTQ